jgi:hypothetical protein
MWPSRQRGMRGGWTQLRSSGRAWKYRPLLGKEVCLQTRLITEFNDPSG